MSRSTSFAIDMALPYQSCPTTRTAGSPTTTHRLAAAKVSHNGGHHQAQHARVVHYSTTNQPAHNECADGHHPPPRLHIPNDSRLAPSAHCTGLTSYVQSRFQAENLVMRYVVEAGLPAVATCVSSTYGSGDWG